MPLHDYRCPEHGLFEAFEPQCPQGCAAVCDIVFLKPVGVKTARTTGIDNALRAQADAFGMSDMRSTREGDNQIGYLPNPTGGAQEAPANSPVIWGTPGQEHGAAAGQFFNIESIVRGQTLSADASQSIQPISEALGFQSVKQRTVVVGNDPSLKVPKQFIAKP